eukprot:758121-Hanusia_phi.AAC.1
MIIAHLKSDEKFYDIYVDGTYFRSGGSASDESFAQYDVTISKSVGTIARISVETNPDTTYSYYPYDDKYYLYVVNRSLSCNLCAIGKYSEAAGSTTCTTCPANSTTSKGGATDLKLCSCISGYVGLDGSTCTACPAQTYKKGRNPGSCVACPSPAICTECPRGSDSAGDNGQATDCLCSAGSVWDRDSEILSCRPCAPGTYSGWAGAASCEDCELGKYSSEEASTACTACPAGKSAGGLASEGCKMCETAASAGSLSCANCVCSDRCQQVSTTYSERSGTIASSRSYMYTSNLSCSWLIMHNDLRVPITVRLTAFHGRSSKDIVSIYSCVANWTCDRLDLTSQWFPQPTCQSNLNCSLVQRVSGRLPQPELVQVPTGIAKVTFETDVAMGSRSFESKYWYICPQNCIVSKGALIATGVACFCCAIIIRISIGGMEDSEGMFGDYEKPTEEDKELMNAILGYKLMLPFLLVIWTFLFCLQLLVALWDTIVGTYSSVEILFQRIMACPIRAILRDILIIAAVIQMEQINIADRNGFAKFGTIFNFVQLWNLVLEISCILTTGRFFGELRASQAYNVLVLVVLFKALYTTESSKAAQVIGTMLLSFSALPAIEVFLSENVKGRPHVLSFMIACCTTVVGCCLGQNQGGHAETLYRIGFLFNGLETAVSFLAASDVCPIGALFSFLSQGNYRMNLETDPNLPELASGGRPYNSGASHPGWATEVCEKVAEPPGSILVTSTEDFT